MIVVNQQRTACTSDFGEDISLHLRWGHRYAWINFQAMHNYKETWERLLAIWSHFLALNPFVFQRMVVRTHAPDVFGTEMQKCEETGAQPTSAMEGAMPDPWETGQVCVWQQQTKCHAFWCGRACVCVRVSVSTCLCGACVRVRSCMCACVQMCVCARASVLPWVCVRACACWP